MKQLAFISGAIFGSTFGIGALFKIMHWPGAGTLLVLSLCIFSLVFIPSTTKYLFDKATK